LQSTARAQITAAPVCHLRAANRPSPAQRVSHRLPDEL